MVVKGQLTGRWDGTLSAAEGKDSLLNLVSVYAVEGLRKDD